MHVHSQNKIIFMEVGFFFSSRRRHTRFSRDWSSDVCSSDLSDFFVRSLAEAKSRGAPLFIVQMDTPGGLDSAMRDMIQAIIASPVPVVMYVAPSGARAASAGTYLLYASHVAAMAPATNLGAATPVQIGGSPPPSTPE